MSSRRSNHRGLLALLALLPIALAACGSTSINNECATGSDCESGVCDLATAACAAPGCADGTQNGSETGIDCGGPDCGPCAAPSCADGAQDGSETGIDCGGLECAPCADGVSCQGGRDCRSGVCDPATGTCVAPSCADRVQNGSETGTDCGGLECAPCADGVSCQDSRDCRSGVCDPTTGTCAAPSCADDVQNGDEVDVDCGGASCGSCAFGQDCAAGPDCASGVCRDSVCAYPTSCLDALANVANPTDGVYTVDPGTGPVDVYCDMTTDGGGWMLMAKFSQPPPSVVMSQ